MPERGETGRGGHSGRTTTERTDWRMYEEEKKKLREQGLSPKEYERRVKALAARLGR